MSSKYFAGDVVRVRRDNTPTLCPALVLSTDIVSCPPVEDMICIRARYFHPPYRPTNQVECYVKEWKSPRKYGPPKPQWLREAFDLAEKYLANRQGFALPKEMEALCSQLYSERGEVSNGVGDTATAHGTIHAPNRIVRASDLNAAHCQTTTLSTETTQKSPNQDMFWNSEMDSSTLRIQTPVNKTKNSQQASFRKSLSRTPAPITSTINDRSPLDVSQPANGDPLPYDMGSPIPPRSGLDLAEISVHLSPLYKILYADCSRIIDIGELKHSATFDLPQKVFSDRLRMKGVKAMLAPIADNTMYPVAWPKPREFSMAFDSSIVPISSIPSPWAVKSGLGGPENLEPLSCMYLLMNISAYVVTQQIRFVFERKCVDSASRKKYKPFRFALLVLEYCEIPRFLGKIESLLEKKKWRDSSFDLEPSDSQEETDVIMENSVVISLKCPISMLSIRVPVRSAGCTHAQVADLSSFVSHIHQSKQWGCPLCSSKIQCLWDIVVDSGLSNLIGELNSSGSLASKAILYSNGHAEACVHLESHENTDQAIIPMKSREVKDENPSVESHAVLEESHRIKSCEDSSCGNRKESAIEID